MWKDNVFCAYLQLKHEKSIVYSARIVDLNLIKYYLRIYDKGLLLYELMITSCYK